MPNTHQQTIINDVSRALAEDIGSGDCTAELIAEETQMRTQVIAREKAILAGTEWFNQAFFQIDPNIEIHWLAADGESVQAGQTLCYLKGSARTILSAERTGLNFLQTLSATASLANAYVLAVAGTKARILDTRKTIPGLRMAQKYAARCGGANNHRIGLFDAILIKENHISAASSISKAVATATSLYPDLLLEVEVETLDQLAETVAAGAQRALLDNFNLELLRQAVQQFSGQIELEASGGVSLKTVRAIAETGVDFISVGEITKNIKAVDLSMRFISD